MSNSQNFLLAATDSVLSFELNDMTLTIDYFNESDLDHLISVENGAGPNPWSRKNFISSLASSHQCVALRHDGTLIAHCVLSFAVGEAEVLIFSVDSKYQGMGIGRQFLERLLVLCEIKAEQVFLEVRESNEAAICLYDSVGFNQIGERPNYYPATSKTHNSSYQRPLRGGSPKESALIYAKDL